MIRRCSRCRPGACWPILVDNIGLLFFGTFPAELRWRAALALVIVFAGPWLSRYSDRKGYGEKPGLAQYCDVLGHGRSCQLEASRDGAGRHLPLANKVHDLEPGLVAQCLNLYQDGQRSIEP